ncbi:MAG: TolC family protein, partial [Phycisphaerales bacterium]
TAEAWFYAITAKQLAAIDEDLLAIYEKTLEITSARKKEGVASQMDIDLAAGNVANARQSLARSRGAREDAVRSLEVLLGRYPSAELEVASDLPGLPGPVPTGLPSELLERRPDVVAADREVAAAFYRTGSARAARLPTFTISGSIGTLLNPTAAVWSLGGNLLAPIVDGGARKADVEIAEGRQKQSLGIYVKTAINGFREVETALANGDVLAQREEELKQAADRYGKARRSAEVSYKEGAISLVDLNGIQSQDAATRAELVRVRGEQLRQRLKLHLALGGSFEAAK